MATRIIPCLVTNEYVQGSGVVAGAAGSHDDVILRLTFGSMWDDLTIYATFRDALGENPTVVIIVNTMAVPGMENTYDVPIPAAAKGKQGRMMLTLSGYSIVGGSLEDTATVTTTAYFRILPSDYMILEDGSIDATIAQQLQTAINAVADAIDIIETSIAGFLPTSGGTMTGPLTLAGAPTNNLHAATKKYVDDSVSAIDPGSNYLAKSGGTMTGSLILAGAPTQDLEAATKAYADALAFEAGDVSSVNGKAGAVILDADDVGAVDKSGDTMTGALTLPGAPTDNLHAATKKYVDDGVGAINNKIGAASGIASLDSNGKVPSAQIPSLNFIPTSEKDAASGVAGLDSNSKVKASEASSHIVAVSSNKTLALTDAGTFQNVNSSNNITVTIPLNSSVAFPTGTEIEIYRGGSGTVTIAGASGVTLVSPDSAVAISVRYGTAVLKKIDTNTWVLGGVLG